MERDNDAHWSIDKRVNLSHIIATGTMLVSLFVWGNKMDNRVTALEVHNQNNTQSMQILDNRLNRIENKLDRLIEKSIK